MIRLFNKAAAEDAINAIYLHGEWIQDESTKPNIEFLAVCLQAAETLNLPECSNSIAEEAELLFYLCCEAARHRSAICPVADICLLVLNIFETDYVCAPADAEKEMPKNLVCLDLSFLPVAIMAAAEGISVTVTAGEGGESLLAQLRRALPHTAWSLRQATAPLPAGAFVLGEQPAALLEAGALDVLKDIQGGILFSYWDFLGVETQGYARERWLQSGLVRGVLQLPRPRRQSAGYYPALIALGQGTGVRLAHYECKGVGAGTWEQEKALQLLCGPAVEPLSVDMDEADLFIKGVPDLTPRYHLSRRLETDDAGRTVRLGEVAQVIRCQLPREEIEDEMFNFLDMGRDEGGISYAFKEMSLANLDSVTGFITGYGKSVLVKKLNTNGKQGKYVLRQDDIVMVFRGTEASIAKVGFCEFEGNVPAITSQTLCLLRAFAVEPVWLYYHLSKPEVRAAILAKAVGSRMLTVNLGDLRELPITLPRREMAEWVHSKHREVVRLQYEIKERQETVRDCLHEMQHELTSVY